jgi:hypothetical protein
MAQKVVVEMVDDLDGTAGADVTTVAFVLDGRSYEIDLSSKNAEQLRSSLAEYVAGARRAGGRSRPAAHAGVAHNSAAREQAHAIRQWARESGHEVSDRGRIPAAVIEAFEIAQRAPVPAAPVSVAPEPAAAKPRNKRSAKKPAEPQQPAFSG